MSRVRKRCLMPSDTLQHLYTTSRTHPHSLPSSPHHSPHLSSTSNYLLFHHHPSLLTLYNLYIPFSHTSSITHTTPSPDIPVTLAFSQLSKHRLSLFALLSIPFNSTTHNYLPHTISIPSLLSSLFYLLISLRLLTLSLQIYNTLSKRFSPQMTTSNFR